MRAQSSFPSQVKSGLQFLRRMGIIEKCGLNGEGDGDASSDEEIVVSRGTLAATASDGCSDGDNKVKAKKKAAKKVLDKAKIQNATGFKVRILSPHKKGKVVPKTSISKKSSEDKVKREINSRPKRLSKELAAVCGKRILSRHEVSG